VDKRLSLTIQEDEFIFDCRRAIYWPDRKILLATDLHWGKTAYMQQHGIAISDKVFAADLERLSHALQDYDVQTLIVLGDLIHHEQALSKSVIDRVARFRHANPCELLLIKGNHDRNTKFPDSWGVVDENELVIGNYFFTHELNAKEKRFQFSGHIHPTMRFRSGHDQLRLPTFILSPKSCLLPAFSHFTGGQDMKLTKEQKAIALLEDGLMLFEKSDKEKNRDQE
jgi:DNA ligase-associated metallophosphoesterase